ncbi:myophilin [Lepeophtheirus salmonis]|uniref:Calponin n=2 Tax=Lepeophtheirus salmonis TaxID=72036 RepID=C1BT79_LEPSM|nr:myophilin-like [Lepeophtheirus salmonis]XP_040575788.1 myophilin-like [Lepeophtheirus salmonis]XP_040575795.1 myophilin-like [Lepeophtheirus salmonis]ACO12232.1 Myophilin [Lepeophtheirus salmonis]ADD24566.1 Myophilin [Lepeophtheirus salmonis]
MGPRKPEEEKEILQWVESVLEEPLPKGDFEEILQNGVILCKLMNKISPGAISKFKEKGPAFLLMENINAFLKAVKAYGVPEEEAFQTPDLFEARNISQVTLCLYSLGRITQKHPEYTGPKIGPKMSTKNERNFTEEQIKAGRDSQIGLQAGSNKGASQAGHGGMGNTRHM